MEGNKSESDYTYKVNNKLNIRINLLLYLWKCLKIYENNQCQHEQVVKVCLPYESYYYMKSLLTWFKYGW